MSENNDILNNLNATTQGEHRNEVPAAAATLYLRLAENHLCLARYADGRPPYFDFCRYRLRPRTSLTVNLREALDSEPILKSPFHRVEALTAGRTTLVPLSDFQEEDCETIYNYCFPEKQRRRVFYDTIPGANAVLLFSLEENTCQALENAFGNVRYTSALTPVLRHFSTKSIDRAHRCLYVHCHEQVADLAVFEDYRLIMANTYEVYNASDVAYYVLNVARQTGVDLKSEPVFVVDNDEQFSKVSDEIRRFASQLTVLEPAKEFKQHIVASTPDVPYDLINLLIH